MTFLAIWGWLCAALGTFISVPQLVRLMRHRSSAGLSLLSWQLMLAISIAWTGHGILIHAPNMWAPNIVVLAGALGILRLIQSDRRLGLTRTFVPGLALGALFAGLDVVLGATVFGAAMVVPQAVGALGQLRELLRASDLRGISVPFLVLAVVVPTMWLVWGVMAHDPALLISASVTAVLGLVNLATFTVRRLATRRTNLVASPTC